MLDASWNFSKNSMNDNDFERFFAERIAAADSFCNGDVEPLLDLVPKEGDVSFHSPDGETLSGAAVVADRFGRQAVAFAPGGTSRLEVLQKEVSGDLGFWTGFQIATLNIPDQDEPLQMKIRVTEVFRRIDGTWKFVHRHADRCTR